MLERYTLPEMKALWEPQNRFQKWLELEILACEAWSELGRIPVQAVREIRERARFDVGRIAEIEAVTRHDVIAFVSCVAESVGDAGKYLHFGLTSYDIVDTALSLLIRDALDLILKALETLSALLADRAREYRNQPMIGRTHGVHAEPISLGLKFALWHAGLDRARVRLEHARQSISVGRLSGAVGTYAHLDPYVENYVCRRVGLVPAKVSTQVLQRDRHAEYLAALAVTAGSLEQFATEIRHLQRTEVLEAEEGFAAGQMGSSAMPHKRNPITCERISGLARVLRGNASGRHGEYLAMARAGHHPLLRRADHHPGQHHPAALHDRAVHRGAATLADLSAADGAQPRPHPRANLQPEAAAGAGGQRAVA